MPNYLWKCRKCEEIWEVFQSMTERDTDPPTHCWDCQKDDKERLEEGLLFQTYDKDSMPKFRIMGAGAFYPNKMQ